MMRSDLLTSTQKEALVKLAVEKLIELVRLPQIRNLLQEVELGLIKHEEGSDIWVKDRRLILNSDGIVEQLHVPHPSWFKRLFGAQVQKDRVLRESEFEGVVEDYKLEPTELQKLINRLQKIPSV